MVRLRLRVLERLHRSGARRNLNIDAWNAPARHHHRRRLGRFRISGFIAWAAWLFIHIFWLIGFRNRVLVLIEWAWYYFTAQRGTRLITDIEPLPASSAAQDGRPVTKATV